MSQTIQQISIKFTSNLSFKRKGVYFILLFSFIGFLLSVTQIFGISPDYDNYNIFFNFLRDYGLDTLREYRFEPGLTAFASILVLLFESNLIIYSFIVAFYMFLKGWVLYLSSSSKAIFLIVVVFYFSRYFPLHELTQFRVAGATSILLWAAIFTWAGKRLYGGLACAAATLFHFSAAAVIPVLFYTTAKRRLVVLIGFSVYALVHFWSNYVVVYLANYLMVFANYSDNGYGDHVPNLFSPVLLLDWAVIVVSLIIWRKLSLRMKQVVFLEIVGMAIFYGSLGFPVIAHRLRELYSVFWVFFIADGLRRKATWLLCFGFALVSAILYSYMFFINGNFFH